MQASSRRPRGKIFTKNDVHEALHKQKEVENSEASKFRTFTSKDGKTMAARIVSLKGNSVALLHRDGKLFVTELSRFSKAGQQ